MGRCHERRRLLMARDHKFYSRSPYRLDDIEILFARNAEDPVHPLVLQGLNEQIRGFFIRRPFI